MGVLFYMMLGFVVGETRICSANMTVGDIVGCGSRGPKRGHVSQCLEMEGRFL